MAPSLLRASCALFVGFFGGVRAGELRAVEVSSAAAVRIVREAAARRAEAAAEALAEERALLEAEARADDAALAEELADALAEEEEAALLGGAPGAPGYVLPSATRKVSKDQLEPAPFVNSTIFTVPGRGYGEVVREKQRRCAIVGGGGSLLGRGRGKQIDSEYDLVVRVNRLPTKRYFEDFGSRTDVLYVAGGTAIVRSGFAMFMGESNDTYHKDHSKVECSKATNWKKQRCPFKAMVVRGVHHQVIWDRRLRDLKTYWAPEAPIPLGLNHPRLARIGNAYLEAFGGLKQPTRAPGESYQHYHKFHREVTVTSGFMAMLTFAPLCESLDLYGFAEGKRGSADGHKLRENAHDYYNEHRLLNELVNGTAGSLILEKELAPDYALWVSQNLIQKTLFGKFRKAD